MTFITTHELNYCKFCSNQYDLVFHKIELQQCIQNELQYSNAHMNINIHDINEIKNKYYVHEFGSLYLYLPVPRRNQDVKAWLWFEFLKDNNSVLSGPWQTPTNQILRDTKNIHSNLFKDDIKYFHIYRIDNLLDIELSLLNKRTPN